MSSHESGPKDSKLQKELSFDGTPVREVRVNGQVMEVDEKTYRMYRSMGATIEEIPHSGGHGEKPLNEYDNTSLPSAVQSGLTSTESIPVTEDPPAHDTIHPKDHLTSKQKLGIAVASAVAIGAAVAGGVGIYTVKKGNDSLEAALNPDKSTSAAPFAEQSQYTPSIEVPMENEDPTYPEVKQLTPLSSEQLSAWESGDLMAQNTVAYEVVAPRLQAVIFEAYDAQQQGVDVDLSWFSNDPAVISEIERVATDFVGVTPADHGDAWFTIEVCRDIDYDSLARCNVKNSVDGELPDLVNGAATMVYSDYISDPGGRVKEHGRGYQLDAHIELVGDTLEFVSNS